MSITLSALMKQRYDTAANWTAQNPTLLAGEFGIESDTKKWKVGDGSTAWTSLLYSNGGTYPLVNADIAANAEIAVSKLADGSARQLLQTDAAGTGVEWTSDVSIPGVLSVTAGTATAAGIQVGTGTTYKPGIYSPGADQLAISTNGAGRLFVDGSGNISAGTSPATILGKTVSVYGGSSEGASVVLQASNGSEFCTLFSGPTAADPFALISKSGFKFATASAADATGYSEKLRITSTGALNFVGAGTAGSTQAVSFNGSAPVDSLVIDSSGRLLVGTSTARSSSTQTWLSQIEAVSSANVPTVGLGIVRNQADIYGGYLSFAKTRGTSNGATTIVTSGDELGGILFSGADGSTLNSVGASIVASVDGTPGVGDMPGRLVFSTTPDGLASPTGRVRISNTGLFVAFSSNTDCFRIHTSAAASTSDNLLLGRYGATGFDDGTATSIIIRSNGNVLNTNNSYGAISDVKLKENIVDATSQWKDIKALQVRKYNFKEGQTHTQIGLVAQEVELVSPGLVTESPDRDKEGNDLGTVTKSVNYSVLYMKAVKALQETMERIESLEARLTAAGIE